MRYFATPNSEAVRALMTAGQLACIVAPGGGKTAPPGAVWCADNGCFGKGYPGDVEWFRWLTNRREDPHLCAFAVAPDVVADAAATLERSAPWLPLIRGLGLPAAFVAQDGQELLPVPWDTFDVLFVGGTTAWKLGPAARALIVEAHRHGKRVHCGRVNSRRRVQYAAAIGCDSVDGTFLAFAPDGNLRRLLPWLDELREQPPLFDLTEGARR